MNRSTTRFPHPFPASLPARVPALGALLGPALFLAACQAAPPPSSGFVWCEYYAPGGVVYFSPVVPSQRPIRGRFCDGFAETVRETRRETRGIVPDTLAYPTEGEAEERRRWHIGAKRKNGLEVATVDWRPRP